jgi:hypothetical protein
MRSLGLLAPTGQMRKPNTISANLKQKGLFEYRGIGWKTIEITSTEIFA